MNLSRIFLAFVLGYAALGVQMLRWQFSHGPPYYQASVALLVLFAISAAVAGLLSVWVAIGALHWARRGAYFIVAMSVLSGLWLLFFAWNRYLIWQVFVQVFVQVSVLVGGLGFFRFMGFKLTIAQHVAERESNASQFSTRDLLYLISAFSLFFAVLQLGHPVELGIELYAILIAGGSCAALVSLTAFCFAFSKANPMLRLLVLASVAPSGGFVYAIAESVVPLLFSSGWYAGVTSLQMLMLVVPFTILRRYTTNLGRSESWGA